MFIVLCENTDCMYCFEGECQHIEVKVDKDGKCTSFERKEYSF